ncbi:Ferric uptake regulation protein [Thermoflexales bacterium]|jgi:Fur family ferric uptake transcriptional regulator|nr:Ferric uptake regulation protein [Thermoflexales bacterium]
MAQFADQARQTITAEGGRMTEQRQIILDVIDRSHEHLTADDITARARRLDRTINSSTVYRTLSLLKDRGLIKARCYTQDTHREVFEPTPNTEHYHFTCLRCGKVIEFESKHVPALRAHLQNEFGVEVQTACLCLTGLCDKCRGK